MEDSWNNPFIYQKIRHFDESPNFAMMKMKHSLSNILDNFLFLRVNFMQFF